VKGRGQQHSWRHEADQLADAVQDRVPVATPLRRAMNKVFPDHWSFMLGEIALYSFVMLLLTGTFLALFFDPSPARTTYHGAYLPLRGVSMSQAYRTALDLSFQVRGGLLIRQMHHWAADLFMAAILVHMLRIFFTGAFRKPRDVNWLIGMSLFWLGLLEGFAGYSMPDDGLSGTGLRIAYSIVLSIPVAGTWLATSLFGGAFPGTEIIGRLYIAHVLLVPALILALVSAHLALVVKQKHTQWQRPGRTEHNVVGTRMVPHFALSSTGLALFVFAVVALLGGLFQINPIWLWGPYQASDVSAASQPDWYMFFLEGALRIYPAWEIRAWHHTVPAPFFPAVLLPLTLALLAFTYPWLERWHWHDHGKHQLVQRPRDVPGRTAVGAMAVAFYAVLSLSGANDVIADKFHISLNAMTWAGRIGILLLPPLAYYTAHRLALALQQHDRQVLVHGVETGQIRRDPQGRYYEVHQPLGPVDGHGHGTLPYAGWAVPKSPNRIGALLPAVKGFFVPVESPADGTSVRRPAGAGVVLEQQPTRRYQHTDEPG
jgi:quinol---cytochrome-c reductase cytochrome b subunit